MQSLTAPRHHMIDGQLEPNRILSERLIAAMGVVEREKFVPEAYQQSAYIDECIPLGKQRYMLSPMVLGHMLQTLDVQPGQNVLVVGAATGYSSVLLHHLGCDVHALEESSDLANKARQTLSSLGLSSVHVHTSAMQMGWMAAAPYDAILIEGGVHEVPPALTEQLKDGGKLVYIAIEDALPLDQMGQGFVSSIIRSGNDMLSQSYDGVNAPLMPGSERKEGFAF